MTDWRPRARPGPVRVTEHPAQPSPAPRPLAESWAVTLPNRIKLGNAGGCAVIRLDVRTAEPILYIQSSTAVRGAVVEHWSALEAEATRMLAELTASNPGLCPVCGLAFSSTWPEPGECFTCRSAAHKGAS